MLTKDQLLYLFGHEEDRSCKPRFSNEFVEKAIQQIPEPSITLRCRGNTSGVRINSTTYDSAKLFRVHRIQCDNKTLFKPEHAMEGDDFKNDQGWFSAFLPFLVGAVESYALRGNSIKSLEEGLHKILTQSYFESPEVFDEAAEFTQTVVNSSPSQGFVDMIKKYNEDEYLVKGAITEFILMHGMRSKFFIGSSEVMRNALCDLYMIYGINKQGFWQIIEVLFEIIKSDFDGRYYGNSIYNQDVYTTYTDFKKIEYRVTDAGKQTKYSITDCRGVSILLFRMYQHMFYESSRFDNPEYRAFWNMFETDSYENLSAQIIDCIGDDAVSKIFLCQEITLQSDDKVFGEGSSLSYNRDYYCIDNKTYIKPFKFDKKIKREDYEEMLLAQYKYGGRIKGKVDGYQEAFLADYNQRYFSIRSIFGALCIVGASSFAGMSHKCEKVTIENQKLKEELDKARSEIRSKDKLSYDFESKDSEISSLNQEIDRLNEDIQRLKKLNESYITERDSLIESRTSYFNEEELSDELQLNQEEFPPMSEMVSFINDFDIFIVGGLSDLPNLLEDMGVHSCKFFPNVNAFTAGRQLNVDFIIVNTRFCKHKDYYMVKSTFNDMHDRILHYNGANVKVLIQCLYRFINTWLSNS